MNSDGEILVEARRLQKHYRVSGRRTGSQMRAVDGVDIAIRKGETLGLVGESGCGKSTLGRLLIRLIEPTSGLVLYQDDDLTALGRRELRTRRRDLQMIFQDPYGSLNPRKTAGSTIREAFVIHGLGNRAERVKWTARMLDLVGLPQEAANRYPHEFSGGQRQRIGIARALALRPKFVVSDESVSALDVSVQSQIINLMQDLQAEFGLTYLFISHNLAVVRHISTRIAVMYLGRIVEIGGADALFSNPVHPYTRALLASTPTAHPRHAKKRELLKGDPPSPLALPKGCRFAPRCQYAEPRCAGTDPALREVSPGRSAACIRAEDRTLPSWVQEIHAPRA
ncbi:MAG: ABC transporter ATP-binding protein [Rhizobiales bacterium]|nr:ABC transporter ATP-binding protein [Hyphomicrobiales bacterium]